MEEPDSKRQVGQAAAKGCPAVSTDIQPPPGRASPCLDMCAVDASERLLGHWVYSTRVPSMDVSRA